MTLGDVIYQYRMTHNISMDKFSEMSGISKGYISMLEKNQTQRGDEPSPSIEMYRNVAKAIGIDVNDLIRMVESNISMGAAEDLAESGRNILRLAGRDGSFREETLSDKSYKALISFLDLLEDVPDGI